MLAVADLCEVEHNDVGEGSVKSILFNTASDTSLLYTNEIVSSGFFDIPFAT